jgi:hypothetical protein
LADHLLVGKRSIDLSGVEERDAAFKGRADQRDTFVLSELGGVAEVQPHAAEADGGDFQVTVSKFARFHVLFLSFEAVSFRLEGRPMT